MSNKINDQYIENVLEELTEDEKQWLQENGSVEDYMQDNFYVMDAVNEIREKIAYEDSGRPDFEKEMEKAEFERDARREEGIK